VSWAVNTSPLRLMLKWEGKNLPWLMRPAP
jgi:hypothetical protein